ncbi:MAG: DUF11 domain-containing protein [Thermoflexales bacterium]|nr:DUF11 domain-containing protein [Thermoflexales bacterium]
MNQVMHRVLPVITIASLACILVMSIAFTPAALLAAPNTAALVRTAPVIVTATTQALSVPVEIRIDDVNDLYGADVRLTFNPALLAVQDANPGQAGIQIGLGPLLTSSGYYVVFNSADNLSGTIQLVITQLNPAQPITGSGILANVTFVPVGLSGLSSLHFTQVKLATRSGTLIPSTAQDGSIVIQPTPANLATSTKLVSAEAVSPTGQLTYTLVLANSGESVASSVTLTDAIPVGATYRPGSLSGGGATYNPGLNRIEWAGIVSAASSVTLSYAVDVSATVGSTIINEAYVSVNSVLDRVLTTETPVTPAASPPPKILYLPIISNGF